MDSGNFKPGDWDNANLYTAFGGSPLDMSDPSGHDFTLDGLLGYSAISADLDAIGGQTALLGYSAAQGFTTFLSQNGYTVTNPLVVADVADITAWMNKAVPNEFEVAISGGGAIPLFDGLGISVIV